MMEDSDSDSDNVRAPPLHCQPPLETAHRLRLPRKRWRDARLLPPSSTQGEEITYSDEVLGKWSRLADNILEKTWAAQVLEETTVRH